MPTTHVHSGSALELQEIADALGGSRKVVVVTGAGISTNCGIPDFRSENGLYSLIQAQYDTAMQNPPWQTTNTFDIDNRPKKKRKSWYYEVVAPDGEVVDVIDEELSAEETKRGSRPSSRSASTSNTSSRASTPNANSTDASSVSGPPSAAAEPLNEDTCKNSTNFASKTSSRRSSRKAPMSPVVSPTTPAIAEPSVRGTQQVVPDGRPATATESGGCSRPPSRANSLKLESSASVAVGQSEYKELPLTRTRILQRQESSILTTTSEDEEAAGPPSSQSSRSSLPNLKGRDLFDSMVWSDAFTTSIFYMFISSLRKKIQNEVKATTETHKFLRVLRDGGRLVRNYTQNIDALEEREGLCTDLTLGPGSRARFHSKLLKEPRPSEITVESAHSGGVECVMLHGSLVALRCGICSKLSSWDEAERETTTLSGHAPDCPSCTEYNAKRTGKGRRGLAVGRLRPDIVLYGEEHPQATLVSPLITHDLGLGPDVLLIMGTSLRVHGLKIMVKEFAKAVHTRGGTVVFVNRTKPPESTWGDVIDYWVEWDCDAWVLDLKQRREDIWLPQGARVEQRRESGEAKIPTKKAAKPQCIRDDKANGIFLTYKILDTLRALPDETGVQSTRLCYWEKAARTSMVSEPATVLKKAAIPKKASRKSEPIKKAVATPLVKKSAGNKKRKSEPVCFQDDKVNASLLAKRFWEGLRLKHPALSEDPPSISHAILEDRCRNITTTTRMFAFNGTSNYLPNLPGTKGTRSGLEKINLITHPPSGATIPVHTPKVQARNLTLHRHHTRHSSKFDSTGTIVVEGHPRTDFPEKGDTIVVEPRSFEVGNEENRMPTPPGSDPMTPSSSRIKRMSIGAILSGAEESESSEEWHDAPEVMT